MSLPNPNPNPNPNDFDVVLEDYDLSESNVGTFRLAFQLLDKDGDGKVSAEDLGRTLVQLGDNSISDASELTELIQELYRPNSSDAFRSRPNSKVMSSRPGSQPQETDFITFEMFSSLLNAKMRDVKQSKINLVNTLKAFDDNGSGYLEVGKFKMILQNLGGDQLALSDEDFIEILESCHLDSKGQLKYAEFVERMLSV